MNTQTQTTTRQPARRSRSRDFYQRYDLLLASWFLLPRRLQQELQFLRADLHEELASWRSDRPKPDWSAYADRIRLICKEGGVALPAYCANLGASNA